MSVLDRWNTMPEEEAAAVVLPCCGSHAWALNLVSRRPLGTLPELLAASDSAWWSLPVSAWDEAFQSHPRIGESKPQGAASRSAIAWSNHEQSAVAEGVQEVRDRLATLNREYEAKFGRVFLIRAAGRAPYEIVEIAERRLRNAAEAELQEAAEQQREITHLRLQKWLALEEIASPLGTETVSA